MPEYRSQKAMPFQQQHTTPVGRILLLVTAGFLFAAITINTLVTRPYWHPDLGVYSAQLRAINELSDKISTVFVGSSHIWFSIYPDVFDETEKSGGTSFNLGVAAALMPVQKSSLQFIEQAEMGALQTVFFEPMLFDVPVTPALDRLYENIFSTRNRYYYDFPTSKLSMEMRWNSDRTLPKKIFGIASIVAAYFAHLSNLGIVPDIWSPAAIDTDRQRTVLERRGYGIRQKQPHTNDVMQAPDIEDGYRSISDTELRVLDDFITLIRNAGAEPVFLFPPARLELGRQRAIRDAVSQRYGEIKILDYTYDVNPIDIYSDINMWADEDHLSMKGATQFSEILARDWQEYSSGRDK